MTTVKVRKETCVLISHAARDNLQGGTGLDVAAFAMTQQARTIGRDCVVSTSGEIEDASLVEISEWVPRRLA